MTPPTRPVQLREVAAAALIGFLVTVVVLEPHPTALLLGFALALAFRYLRVTGPPTTPAPDEVERWVVLQVSAVVVRDGRVMRVRVTADLVRPLVGIEGGGLTEVGMRDMWETTPDLAPMVGGEGPLSSFPGREGLKP